MPLSARQKHLLFEIYGVTYVPSTVVTSGGGVHIESTMFDFYSSVKAQLLEAIALIDNDESRTARIAEILEEYDNWALDFSTIEREGYSMRPSANLKRVQLALYVYTGILFAFPNSNKLSLG